ncbi:MAG TPA: hypothetical protein DCG28_01475 [Lachnospiraceae bacterium]|nr:hypothetical protein [Lachnospiraceae bacterium]
MKIKKIVAALLTAVMVPTFMSFEAFAAELTVSAENVSVSEGEKFDFPVKLSGNPGIMTVGFNVNYPEALTLKSVKNGEVFEDNCLETGPMDKSPYTVSFLDPSIKDTSKNGVLLTLTFEVKQGANGEYPISFSTDSLSGALNVNEEWIDMSFKDGSVVIGDAEEKQTELITKRQEDKTTLVTTEQTTAVTTEQTSEETTEESTEQTEGESKTDENTALFDTIKLTIGSNIVLIGDKELEMDAKPYIQSQSSSTLVPLRFASVAILGGDASNSDSSDLIEWDPEKKSATIHLPQKDVTFTADSSEIIIDSEAVEMDYGVKAEITEGRMYIPFRALGNALGVAVDWDAESKTAIYTVK